MAPAWWIKPLLAAAAAETTPALVARQDLASLFYITPENVTEVHSLLLQANSGFLFFQAGAGLASHFPF